MNGNRAKKPTKAELQRLVVAYYKRKEAERQRALMAIRQRLYDQYMNILNRLIKKYPNVFPNGYVSPEFLEGLDRAAERYRSNKAVRGASADW